MLCTGLAYILYFRLIERAGPSRALAVTFITPLFAVLYGMPVPERSRDPVDAGLRGGHRGCGTLLSTGLVTRLWPRSKRVESA